MGPLSYDFRGESGRAGRFEGMTVSKRSRHFSLFRVSVPTHYGVLRRQTVISANREGWVL